MIGRDIPLSRSDCWMYVGTKRAVKKPINIEFIGFFGVPGGIRTHDLPLRRRTLYPAELQRLIQLLMPLVSNYWRDLGGGRSILLSYGEGCGPRDRGGNYTR